MKRGHNSIQSLLPEGYEPLEYIESTGTQWIDSNLVVNNTHTRVDADIRLTNINPSETKMVFGNNYSGYFQLVLYSDARFQMNCGVAGNTLDLFINYANLDRNHIFLEKKNNNYNVSAFGTELHGTAGNINMRGMTMPIFCRKANATIGNIIEMQLYSTEIQIMHETVRSYIPALCISNSKPGLYDLCGSICPLTGTPFYINAGTGEFLYE